MHKCQQSLNESRKDTRNIWGYFGLRRAVQRYRMPCLWDVIWNCFWDGADTKIPEKIVSAGFASGVRLCHERKMNATRNILFFGKKEWFDKACNVVYHIGLLPFEPGPNSVRIQTFSALRPRPRVGLIWGPASRARSVQTSAFFSHRPKCGRRELVLLGCVNAVSLSLSWRYNSAS
jgi:hypothetical protein